MIDATHMQRVATSLRRIYKEWPISIRMSKGVMYVDAGGYTFCGKSFDISTEKHLTHKATLFIENYLVSRWREGTRDQFYRLHAEQLYPNTPIEVIREEGEENKLSVYLEGSWKSDERGIMDVLKCLAEIHKIDAESWETKSTRCNPDWPGWKTIDREMRRAS